MQDRQMKPMMPGDWLCPTCGDLQFARNPSCRKCGAQKPADAPGGGVGAQLTAAQSMGFAALPFQHVTERPIMPGDWLCPQCGDLQFARNNSCRKCGAPKPDIGPGGEALSAEAMLQQLAAAQSSGDDSGGGAASMAPSSLASGSGAVGKGMAARALAASPTALPPVPAIASGDRGQMVYAHALVQMAQESAEYAVTAAAYSVQYPMQAFTLLSGAQQAQQQVVYANTVLKSYVPEGYTKKGEAAWWTTLQNIVKLAMQMSDKAVADCEANAPQAEPPKKKTRVACKLAEAGRCLKGDFCNLSHDPEDMRARSAAEKRPVVCRYWNEGKCMRGDACAFAHGEDELNVARQEEAKWDEVRAQYNHPGNWKCPSCKDLQFARNLSCRRCKTSKPFYLPEEK